MMAPQMPRTKGTKEEAFREATKDLLHRAL